MSLERIRSRIAARKPAIDENETQDLIDFAGAADIDEVSVTLPAPDYDIIPRETVRNLLNAPREVEFTFKTEPYGGEAYVGAMRSVLSRARKDLRKAGKKPKEFKLFVVSIEHRGGHDFVTMLRTEKHRSLLHKSVYDDLMGELTDEQ